MFTFKNKTKIQGSIQTFFYGYTFEVNSLFLLVSFRTKQSQLFPANRGFFPWIADEHQEKSLCQRAGKVNSQGETSTPRGSCHSTLKLVSSSLKSNSSQNRKKLRLLNFALHLLTFDEILECVVSSVPHLSDCQQKLGLRLHAVANCLT